MFLDDFRPLTQQKQRKNRVFSSKGKKGGVF